MDVRCIQCGTAYRLPPGGQPHQYMCSVCGGRVLMPITPQPQPALIVSGTIGGAALGAAIGGPVGAVVGGSVGLMLGLFVRQ